MKFAKEGEWVVSTPLFIGTKDAVDQMAACAHVEWVEEVRELRDHRIMVMERCFCGATRAKWKPE